MENDDISIEAMRNWLKDVYLLQDDIYGYNEPYNNAKDIDLLPDNYIKEWYQHDSNNPELIHLDADPQKVEVQAWEPIFLRTWYPIGHPWRDYSSQDDFYIGHSALEAGNYIFTKYPYESDYNLVTNNCSDATREVLEAVFGKKADVVGFTTPGDVRDFAIENGGVQLQAPGRLISIPMSKVRWDRLKQFLTVKK